MSEENNKVVPRKHIVGDLFSHLKHQCNFALVVSTFLYCWLMHDRTMWFYFLIIEILYLVLSVNNGPLLRVFNVVKESTGFPHWEWDSTGILSWLLLAFSIGWAVWHADSISMDGETVSNAYGRWEAAALLWNVAFTVISFRYLPPPERRWSRIVTWVVFSSIPLLCIKHAFSALAKGDYESHLGSVLLIALFYLGVDLIVWRENPDTRSRYLTMVLYADLPTAIALGVLYFFSEINKNERSLNIFLSGAIAFQFIASSLVVALIEGKMPEKHANNSAHTSASSSSALGAAGSTS